MATATATRNISDLSDADLKEQLESALRGKPTDFSGLDIMTERDKRAASKLASVATGGANGPVTCRMPTGKPGDTSFKPKGNVNVRNVPGANSRFGLALFPHGMVALAEGLPGMLEFIRDNRHQLVWGFDLQPGEGSEAYLPRIEALLAKLS